MPGRGGMVNPGSALISNPRALVLVIR